MIVAPFFFFFSFWSVVFGMDAKRGATKSAATRPNSEATDRLTSLYQRRLDVYVNPHPGPLSGDANFAGSAAELPGGPHLCFPVGEPECAQANMNVARRKRCQKASFFLWGPGGERENDARGAIPRGPRDFLTYRAFAHGVRARKQFAPSALEAAHAMCGVCDQGRRLGFGETWTTSYGHQLDSFGGIANKCFANSEREGYGVAFTNRIVPCPNESEQLLRVASSRLPAAATIRR